MSLFWPSSTLLLLLSCCFRTRLHIFQTRPSIDFFVFTDENYESLSSSSGNVKIFHYTFDEIKDKIQKKLRFPVSLDSPYKLCDFKPAYGEIFSDYLSDYDYWGHCDVDLIWGNIRKFVTDELLEKNIRLFTRGHCSIYRNTSEVNMMYRTLPANGHLDWRKVFQSPKSFCFDEWAGHCGGGTTKILMSNGIEIYDEPVIADLAVLKGYFKIHNRSDITSKDVYFEYHNGTLFLNDNDKKREFLYCHFQKRKISIDNNIDYSKYYFVAPGLITSNKQKIKRYRISEMSYTIKQYFKRSRKALERRLLINK